MSPVRGDPNCVLTKGIQRAQRNSRTKIWQVTEALLSGAPPQCRDFREGCWSGLTCVLPKARGSDTRSLEQRLQRVYVRGITRQAKQAPRLVEVVPHMLHDGLQPQPGLLCSGDDLVGGQEEAIVPGIS